MLPAVWYNSQDRQAYVQKREKVPVMNNYRRAKEQNYVVLCTVRDTVLFFIFFDGNILKFKSHRGPISL